LVAQIERRHWNFLYAHGRAIIQYYLDLRMNGVSNQTSRSRIQVQKIDS
jgi:hypothetical protein